MSATGGRRRQTTDLQALGIAGIDGTADCQTHPAVGYDASETLVEERINTNRENPDADAVIGLNSSGVFCQRE
ncbi:hypothetical protein ACVW1C_005738 [Bradyrhizobium sp. USDA 4011]